jgi:hypothetical protein
MLAPRGLRDGDTRHAAILGDTKRADGRRGYRHICYLGSFYEGDNIFDRAMFWQQVDARLDGLRLSLDDHVMAVETIASRLPRPSKRQLDAARRSGVRAMVRVGKAVDKVV